MKQFLAIILGLVWSTGFLLARNITFMYEEVWTVLASLGLGLIVHKLPNRLWQLMVFITLSIPMVDYFFLLADSIIPFVIGYLTLKEQRSWKFYFTYLLLPLGLVSNWIYSSEAHSYSIDDQSTKDLALHPLLNATDKEYQLSEDTTYLLSYWHIGCRACLIQDRSLRRFEYRNAGRPFKIISVFLGDTSDRRFHPTVELFHQHFENYLDRNAFVQAQFDQNYGPALLLYKNGKPQKLWRGFTSDSMEEIFMLYYWQWYVDR